MLSSSQQPKGVFYNIDWYMIVLWIALVAIGWLNIYSSASKDEFVNILDITQRYGKQLLWIALAMGIGFIILLIDPRAIPPLSYSIYAVFMLLLVAVLVAGTEINHSKSWFQIGGFALQPSEFAKLATALALSRFMSGLNYDIHSRKSIMTIGGIIVIPLLLILLQPDLGSAIVLVSFVLVLYRFGLKKAVPIAMMAVAILFILSLIIPKVYLIIILIVAAIATALWFKSKTKEIIVIGMIAVSAIVVIFAVDFAYSRLKPHQRQRIDVYISSLEGFDRDIQDVGYNFYQSKVAIGSGGLTGKGFLKGTQTKMNFIPEQDTDFIFCTVGEEWGFLGSMAVITLYLLLLFRILNRAEIQRSKYSKIYGYAIVSILLFHVVVNIGMTMGLTPVIGIPLPFMSYGGSSLWAFTIMVFIFIKQDMHRFEVIG